MWVSRNPACGPVHGDTTAVYIDEVYYFDLEEQKASSTWHEECMYQRQFYRAPYTVSLLGDIMTLTLKTNGISPFGVMSMYQVWLGYLDCILPTKYSLIFNSTTLNCGL
jgi:hypothetical protein